MHFHKTKGFTKHLPLFCIVTSIGCGIGKKQRETSLEEDQLVSNSVTCNPDTSGALRFTGNRVERCGNEGWDDIRNFSSLTKEALSCIVMFRGSPLPCHKISEVLPQKEHASCRVRDSEDGATISCGDSDVRIKNAENGESGATGPKGRKGARGEKGQQGDKGPEGSKGAANPQIGSQGLMGDKGETGEKGDKGETGTEKGERGPIGDSGSVGEKGDTGPNGPMGPTGTQMGIQGPQGILGFQGAKGPNGGTRIPPRTGGGRGGWCRSPDYTYTSEITFGELQ